MSCVCVAPLSIVHLIHFLSHVNTVSWHSSPVSMGPLSVVHFIHFLSCALRCLCMTERPPCICAEDGRVFVWGGSGEGQLGLGEEAEVPEPKELDVGQRVTCIACGYYHSALVTGEWLKSWFHFEWNPGDGPTQGALI